MSTCHTVVHARPTGEKWVREIGHEMTEENLNSDFRLVFIFIFQSQYAETSVLRFFS